VFGCQAFILGINKNCGIFTLHFSTVFAALKEGSKVSMELQETFWSKCFGSLTDKFGIIWNISIECPE